MSNSKRSAPHITRACLGCKQRKIRCQGEQPCSGCIKGGQTCVYSSEEDGRKAGAIRRAAKAKSRKASEAATDEQQQIAASSSEPSTSETLIPAAGVDPASLDTITGGQERLQIDDFSTSTLCHYGPTSALYHLSCAPSFLQSPMSVERNTAQPSGIEQGLETVSTFPWLLSTREINWRKNLPDLPITRDAHDSLLDLCEAFFTPWCRVVDFPAFRKDMRTCLGEASTSPSRTPSYSPLLHNAILAIGACFWHGSRITSEFPTIHCQTDPAAHAADLFVAEAMKHYAIECERPMQSTVNGLLLLASFQSGRANPNFGHVLFTSAVSTSRTLGLDIDSSSLVRTGKIPAEVMEQRNLLFWTCFVQDKLWSLAIGRFLTITSDNHSIPFPKINALQDAHPWRAPKIWSETAMQGLDHANGSPGFISTCHSETIKLALIQQDLLQKCYSTEAECMPHADMTKVTDDLQDRLNRWLENLSSTVRMDGSTVPPPHVFTLHLTYNYTVMLLNRLVSQRFHPYLAASHAFERCRVAAYKTVELLGLYDRLYGLNHAPLSSLQTTFVCATIHLIQALDCSKKRDFRNLESALQGTAICISALNKASLSWRTASRIAKVLQSLFDRWLPGSIGHMHSSGWMTGPPELQPSMNVPTQAVDDNSLGIYDGSATDPSSSLFHQLQSEEPRDMPTYNEAADVANLFDGLGGSTDVNLAGLSSFDFSVEAFDYLLAEAEPTGLE